MCPCHQNGDEKARAAGGSFEGHPAPGPGVPLANVTLGMVGGKATVGYCVQCAAAFSLWLLGEERKRLRRLEEAAAVEELIRASMPKGGR
jgi:hypothetical protein